MATTTTRKRWALEVVRGRDVGRRYALGAGETTIGNEPATAAHVDLGDQEGASPRRMSGRQACLVATAESLAVRDLESPGGTFVNRQRLLSGQERKLQPGDVIQVGGVQLLVQREPEGGEAVVAEPVRPKPSSTTPPNATYTFPGGAVCRTWDDFLTLAAQRWPLVRDELASGRLTEHLRRIQRTDLIPRHEPGQTPDEALDAWLGRLPSTRSSAPELDVHPETLVVRTGAAGGVIRQSLRITNVGYRLLRSTIQIESSTPGGLRLSPDLNGKPLLTIDQSDIGVEIEVPEAATATKLGTIVVASNGGTKRIDVRVERPMAVAFPDEPVDASVAGVPFGSRLASLPLERRFWLFPSVLIGFRLLVGFADRLPLGLPPSGTGEPGLPATAVVMSALGFLIGAVLGSRGGDRLDVAASGFAGAAVGLLASALGFAAIRSVEGAVGSPSSATMLLIVWGLLGAALAAASWVAFPRRNVVRKGDGS
ncbi:MAG: FHA domain-containing protein [Paludisphaera borealis]|uniref:FHA domain-containing protein n=1 Tax=Paludisphaera borealis TaxID=1387353 RepID=UPI00284935F8|nr:FHA domain-containing protein [Paludisphaera borealis]MDR3622264.1 FHA domain-containing protein [Paludisphaera borealis]